MSGKPCVILMAEDDADDQVLARDAFAEAGVHGDLRFVSNGEELTDYLWHCGKFADLDSFPTPALILLDLNMPRKDGRQALCEIKADPELRRIPVVVLTTSKADTEIAKIYDLGANSFITKPVQFAALVKTMKLIGQYWLQAVELPVPKGNSL
jgi:CheY-like chemotaxis protein